MSDLSHYKVAYRAVNISGQDTTNSTVYVTNVSRHVNEITLEDLSYYATYEINLKSINSSGAVLGHKVVYAGKLQVVSSRLMKVCLV